MTPWDQLDAWWEGYKDDEVTLEEWKSLSTASQAILEAGGPMVGEASVKGYYVELPFGLMVKALLAVEAEVKRQTPEWRQQALVKAAVEWRKSGLPRKYEDWDYDTRPALEAAVDAWTERKTPV